MQTLLTTANFHPRDRLAYWYDVACKAFVTHECRVTAPSAFDATLLRGRLGNLGVVSIESRGLASVERTPRSIATGDDDVFLLCLQVRGNATLVQDGREAVIRPGDFALLDAQRHYFCKYQDRKQITIKIPHHALKARLAPTSQLTAHAVRHTDGLGGLVSGYLRLLPSRIEMLQPTEQANIAEHILDLVAAALAAHSNSDARPTFSSARAVALLRLRTAIEAQLADPSLDPSTAAGAAGISVRYANDLLSAEGSSLERLIVSRRLERCRRALEDPAQAHRSIGEIAYAWGFSDLSHFTRRFKAAFGSTPRDYRAAHQA